MPRHIIAIMMPPLLPLSIFLGAATAMGVDTKCSLTDGYDFNGNDLLGPNGKPAPQPVANPAACCDLCASKPESQTPKGNCSAWSFNHGSKTCWMKTSPKVPCLHPAAGCSGTRPVHNGDTSGVVMTEQPGPAVPTGGGMLLTTAKCNPSDANQQFTFSLVAPYTSPAAVESNGICFDLAKWRTTAKRDRPPTNLGRPSAGATVNGWNCGENAWTNQYWSVKSSTLETLHPDAPGLCFGISSTGSGGMLAECSSDAAQFQFGFHGRGNSTLVHKKSGLCVTLTGPPLPPAPPAPPRPPSPKNTPCPPLPVPASSPRGPAAPHSGGRRPCDIYASAGTPCVAAHSMVRALFQEFDGPLYLLQRVSDYKNLSIGVLNPGGYANAAAQEQFWYTTYHPLRPRMTSC